MAIGLQPIDGDRQREREREREREGEREGERAFATRRSPSHRAGCGPVWLGVQQLRNPKALWLGVQQLRKPKAAFGITRSYGALRGREGGRERESALRGALRPRGRDGQWAAPGDVSVVDT